MEKTEILKLVGKRIKCLRESKGISQVELVGKMQGEIDPTNISRIESGRTNPTLFTLWEMITRRPVPQKVLENAQMIGVIFLMGLMLLIFGNDIVKLILGKL